MERTPCGHCWFPIFLIKSELSKLSCWLLRGFLQGDAPLVLRAFRQKQHTKTVGYGPPLAPVVVLQMDNQHGDTLVDSSRQKSDREGPFKDILKFLVRYSSG